MTYDHTVELKLIKLLSLSLVQHLQEIFGILPLSCVFDLCRLCFLFKLVKYSYHNIFMMCLVFMSLTNYVQLILYTDILTIILKPVYGTLSMFT